MINYDIFCKNLKVTNEMKSAADECMKKFEEYFSDTTRVTFKLSESKGLLVCEITVPYRGAIIRVENGGDDAYKTILSAADKLTRRIRKHKTKIEAVWSDSSDENISIPILEEETDSKIVRTKDIPISPMSCDEAILQMQMLGHPFFVFLDEDAERVCVIYSRKDGNIGLIRTFVD